MKELPKAQYDYWEKQATDSLTGDPEGLCKPFCLALRDAIFTLKMRDSEIASLKSSDEIMPGTSVTLKTGGPYMTVARLENNGQDAVCGWFDGRKDKLRTFPSVMLQRASPEDSIVIEPQDEDE